MWPLWVKVYAVVVATPMVVASGAIALWIVLTEFGGSFEDASSTGAVLMIGVFVIAFIFTAVLFISAIKRIIFDEVEALILAATGHLMLAIPAVVFVIISFIDNQNRFVADVEDTIEGLTLNPETRLILWLVFHTYIALILALYDNTSSELID